MERRAIFGDSYFVALSASQREYVISTAVDLLRHRQRAQLLQILRERLDHGDYPDPDEQSLDEIAYAIATTIDEKLRE